MNKVLAIVAIIFFPLVIVLLFSLKIVSAGEVAVVTRFGAVSGRILEPGASFIAPFVEGTIRYNTKKVIYEVTSADKQQGSNADYKDYPVDTNTSDGQQVDIYYTIRFSVDPLKVKEVAQHIGNESSLVEKIVKTESRTWARNIPREFAAEKLYQGDGVVNVQTKIFDRLDPVFKDNGLVLDAVNIREIKFSDQYIQAIESKQMAAVQVETEKNKADQAVYQKQASITNAEAQAETQRLQAITLTPQYLQSKWIERWNGALPTYMTGDAANLIQLPMK